MAHAPTTVARVQRAYEPSLSAHRKLPSRLIVSIPIGGDVAMQRENYSRVPKHVPNSANLRSSEPISGAGLVGCIGPCSNHLPIFWCCRGSYDAARAQSWRCSLCRVVAGAARRGPPPWLLKDYLFDMWLAAHLVGQGSAVQSLSFTIVRGWSTHITRPGQW